MTTEHVQLAENLAAVVKAYDVRGVAGSPLGEREAFTLGRGFGAWLTSRYGSCPVVVGRDCRVSGPVLAGAFIDGLVAQGCTVLDIGLASTDMVYAASGDLGAAGAMVTASHNPAPYNGFKLTGPGAEPVSAEHGLDAIVTLGLGCVSAPPVPGGVVRPLDYLDRFVDLVVGQVDVSSLRGLRLVADTANGMGGLVVPAVAARVGFDVSMLFGELDGTFPNHPADPLNPANLVDLQAAVTAVRADVGLAFDGDADRVFLVDDCAVPVSGSTTTAVVASGLLERFPNSVVLHNLICSRAVREVIVEHGGVPYRTPVGHSLIKRIMAETGAVFGGEHSAHYYFRSFWRADSGVVAALQALALVAQSGQPLSVFRSRFDRYPSSGEQNVSVRSTGDALEGVAAAFTEVDRLDGVSVDAGSWWANVRGSNTEPLLRLNVEGVDQDAVQVGLTTLGELVAPYMAN